MTEGVDPVPQVSDTAPHPAAESEAATRYATFPRRLNALSVDTLVLIGISAVFLGLLSFVQSFDGPRIGLVVLWWFVLLFYEPLMVSFAGGTIGHYRLNLRVVDNRTDGNIPLLRSLIRFWVKVILGVFSFLSMSFTRRHQAVHDVVTNSSVQIRDALKAKPYHYTLGRP